MKQHAAYTTISHVEFARLSESEPVALETLSVSDRFVWADSDETTHFIVTVFEQSGSRTRVGVRDDAFALWVDNRAHVYSV